MLVDPHPSQQHAGIQHVAYRVQHEATRPMANTLLWSMQIFF